MRAVREKVERFLFPPASDLWLSFLRIGLGAQVILYCLSLRADWNHLSSLEGAGFVQRDLMEVIVTVASPLIPRLGWLVDVAKFFGVGEQTTLSITWVVLFCAGLCLIAGFCCRISAILVWFLYLCATESGGPLGYGVDNFTTIGLFYLMLSPFPDRCAVDRKVWGTSIKDRHLHGFFQRVLQLHLCIVYFSSGITKFSGPGWWTGESMWRSLTRPPFDLTPHELVIAVKPALPFIGIAVCVLETGYPLFMWLRRSRRVWLAGILAMHVAIGLAMGLYLFGSVMIVLNLAAFAPNILFKKDGSKDLLAVNGGDVRALRRRHIHAS
jgi:HTTM domain